MMPTPLIRVPERGTRTVEQEQWSALQRVPEFWQLVDAKIVSVEQRGRDSVRLRGGSHVGRARIGNLLLEVQEKIFGATAALMAAAVPTFKIQRVAAPTSGLGDLVRLLVRAYVAEVQDYAGRGREWMYDEQNEVGSTIAGRLDVRRTVDLRARGQGHLAAFHRPFVSPRTQLNRIVLAALREIDILARLQPLPVTDVALARALAVLFEDCLDAEVIGRSPALRNDSAELAAQAPPGKEGLLSLASLLLSHQSLQPEQSMTGTSPVGWFVNLETLFERVVLAALREAAPTGIPVSKGGKYKAMVFPGPGLLNADPDIVVGRRPAAAVGDVKYKNWEGGATASDVYQLLVHASTFQATEAFLVYPSSKFAEIDWGFSSTGCRTRLFAVDVLDVRRDARRLPGMPESVSSETSQDPASDAVSIYPTAL